MLRKKEKSNKLFYDFNLDSFVPEDHFLRLVNEHISFDFIRERVKHLYSHTGQPAIDPVVLIKMLLIGYCYNIKSERQLVKDIQVNLAYRWFINYDIDEEIPDHSTLSQTRRRKFKESNIFQIIFDEIIRQCVALGFMNGDTIFTDSTHIKANASYSSMVEKVVSMEDYLKQLEFNSSNEEKSSESHENKKTEGSKNDSSDKKKNPVKKKLSNKTHISKTDPDSKLMGRKGKSSGLCYLEHRSTDITGYITDVHITPGNVQDQEPYIDRIKRQKLTFKFPIKNAVADKGYGVGNVYKGLTDMNIDAYIPQYTRVDKREGMFDHDDFTYVKDEDYYRCPNKKKLKRISGIVVNDGISYTAGTKHCNRTCPLRAQCTTMKTNATRAIRRNVYQDYIDFQLLKYGNSEWKKLMKKRQTIIEGSFANAKNNHGLGRAKMRGMKNVLEQSLMTAIAQNIKKMISDIENKVEMSKVSISLFFRFLILNRV
jgi:transposase